MVISTFPLIPLQVTSFRTRSGATSFSKSRYIQRCEDNPFLPKDPTMDALFSCVDNGRHSLPSAGPSEQPLTQTSTSVYQGGKHPLEKVASGKKPSFMSAKACQVKLARQQFLLILTKCLLAFGAPTHRIESQLAFASKVLGADAVFVYIPGLVIVTFDHITAAKMQVIKSVVSDAREALSRAYVAKLRTTLQYISLRMY